MNALIIFLGLRQLVSRLSSEFQSVEDVWGAKFHSGTFQSVMFGVVIVVAIGKISWVAVWNEPITPKSHQIRLNSDLGYPPHFLSGRMH